MTSNYFYERCLVGLIDLAYPSNAATFLNAELSERLSHTPSFLLKFPQTDHQVVINQNRSHPHVELGPIAKWPTILKICDCRGWL